LRNEFREARIALQGEGEAAGIALAAAALEPDVAGVEIVRPTESFRDGPYFMRVLQVLDMPQMAGLVFPRPVRAVGVRREAWEWTRRFAAAFGGPSPWTEAKE